MRLWCNFDPTETGVPMIEGDEKMTAREHGLKETTGAGCSESHATALRRCGLGISAGLIACVLGGASISMAADDLGWIVDHIRTDRSTATTFDDSGNVVRAKATTVDRVTVTRTVTDTLAKDESRMIRVQSRVTQTVTAGDKVVSTQTRLPGSSRLTVTSISTNVKQPNGSITTLEKLGKDGQLRIVSRTTTFNDVDTGETTITVEGLSESGRLIVRSVTTKVKDF